MQYNESAKNLKNPLINSNFYHLKQIEKNIFNPITQS